MMATERNHLAQAIWHIAQGEARVRGQRAMVERLAERGQDTRLAEILLGTMQVSLNQMNEHREMIERAIAEERR
jgi:hypothetical protein